MTSEEEWIGQKARAKEEEILKERTRFIFNILFNDASSLKYQRIVDKFVSMQAGEAVDFEGKPCVVSTTKLQISSNRLAREIVLANSSPYLAAQKSAVENYFLNNGWSKV